MRSLLLVALLGLVAGGAFAAEGDFTCKANDLHVTGLLAGQGQKVPLYGGAPGAGLRYAAHVDWQQLSPSGGPVKVTGCFHEGYVRLETMALPECEHGCWIATRWVATSPPLLAQSRPCPELVGYSVAASRAPPEGQQEQAAQLAEKCIRR